MTDGHPHRAHRRPARPRPIAILAVALWLIGVAGTAILAWLAITEAGDWTTLAFLALVPVNIGYGLLGLLILRHHPRHRIGWIYLATPILVSGVFNGFAFAGHAVDTGTVTSVHVVAVWGAAVLFAPMTLLVFPLVALVFPDGNLPGRRWRWPAGIVLGAAALSSLTLAVAPGEMGKGLGQNPFALPALGSAATVVSGALMLLAILGGTALAVASMVVRFRRGRGQERQQLKWVLGALLAITVLVIPSLLKTSGENGPQDVVSGLSLLLLPLSMTVAIMRYRLYDIDRLISRTLSYAILTGVLTAVFAGGVITLQTLLPSVTPGGTLAVAGSTILTAALFQPARRAIQSVLDRRFDRAGTDAQRLATAFAAELRDEVDASIVSSRLTRAAHQVLHPSSASVWIRAGPGPDR